LCWQHPLSLALPFLEKLIVAIEELFALQFQQCPPAEKSFTIAAAYFFILI
jgi:hypothetical protein